MKKNMGSTDRIIRIALAAGLGIAHYTGFIGGTSGTILLGAAIIFLLTSFVRFCPIYALFGISTCPVNER